MSAPILDPASKAHAVANALRQIESLTKMINASFHGDTIDNPEEYAQWISTIHFFDQCYPGRLLLSIDELNEAIKHMMGEP